MANEWEKTNLSLVHYVQQLILDVVHAQMASTAEPRNLQKYQAIDQQIAAFVIKPQAP